MTRRNSNSSKRPRRLQGRDYKAPTETPMLPALAGALVIPPFRAQMPYRKTFRFILNNGSTLSTPWTTSMMLDMYCIAIGGSSAPVRIYNNMKLLGVKVWSLAPVPGEGSSEISSCILEFSPSLVAGFGGAPRVPYVATQNYVSTKYAHLCARPKRDELASQWFSAQQSSYTLFNLQSTVDTVLQLDFLVVEVNGETPVSVAYTSSVAKGTIGVTNFGVSGCRSEGLENLVNP